MKYHIGEETKSEIRSIIPGKGRLLRQHLRMHGLDRLFIRKG
jgi:hypothetical protein